MAIVCVLPLLSVRAPRPGSPLTGKPQVPSSTQFPPEFTTVPEQSPPLEVLARMSLISVTVAAPVGRMAPPLDPDAAFPLNVLLTIITAPASASMAPPAPADGPDAAFELNVLLKILVDPPPMCIAPPCPLVLV